MSEALQQDAVAVRFSGVVKRFPGADALKGIDVEIPEGQIIGLLGPNGSGKSTMLKLIAGLYRPNQGEVRVFGRAPDRTTKAQVAYVPEVDHLYPWMTAEAALKFMAPFFADWDAERAVRLLEVLQLPPKAKVGKMSKGMRARLRLITALARSTRLILLDEPLSGIDPPSRTRIADALLSEYQESAQTVVLSTHEVLEAEHLFDRLIFLEQGRIKLEGDAEDLRQQFGTSVQGMFEEVYR